MSDADIVLLHGWGSTTVVFDDLARGLAVRRAVHVLPLERLGSIDAAMGDVAARAPGACSVVGWSLGAQVAMEWARRRPRQVERLVLIAATPSFVAREDWSHGVDRRVFDAFAQALERDAARTLRRFQSLQAQGDARAKHVMRALKSAEAPATDTQRLAADLRVLLDTDLRAAVHEIAQPTLIVHGAEDRLVPREAAAFLSRTLPAARCEIVEGAAHAPFISSQSRVLKLVEDFLDA